jgi:hypothetical protein
MISVLPDTVNNADIAEAFSILRNPGQFGQGGWQASGQQQLTAYGTVSLASQKEIAMLPEADRITEARIFHSSTPMYVTSEDYAITADILIWRGVQYRAMRQLDYSQRGYYGVIAVRMAGN